MNRTRRHIIFWLCVYVLWTYMKSFGGMRWESWIINIIHVSAYMSIFYGLRQYLIPRFFDQEKWLSFILGVIIWTAMTATIWYGILIALCPYLEIHPTTIPASSGAFILESVQMFVPGLILLAWESFENQATQEAKLHALEKEQLTTELDYLKAQVNPDFLMKTLHQIKTNIEAKSLSSGDMILRLSSILDYVLYKSQKAKVPFQEEAEVIKDYVALDQEGLNSTSGIQLTVVNNNPTAYIAPLTLLTLIEKALNVCTTSNLQIAITSDMHNISCDVLSDNPSHLTPDNLSDFKRQLVLSHPAKHELTCSVEGQSSRTSLTINLDHE